MATKRFRGDRAAVAQVNTITPANVNIGNTFTATINLKEVTVTATAATVANVTALLTAAINASTIPEFREVVATDSTTHVTLTSRTAGNPFTQTSSASGGTATLITATTTDATGPNNWDDDDNWAPAGVPVTSDTVDLSNLAVAILDGLDQSAVVLAVLNRDASHTGQIGRPAWNPAGYWEYRERYLKIGADAVNVGQGDGGGSGQIKLDLGTEPSTVTVAGTGQPSDSSLPALMLAGSDAANVLNATRGSIGLAVESGTTAQFPVIRAGTEGNSNDVDLTCGAGCTLGAITQNGGTVEVRSNVTTWTKYGGTSTVLGTATVGTITQDGTGTHYWQSSGTVTAATFRGAGAVLDASRDLRARTLTNGTFTGGAYLNDPAKTITLTNPINTDQASLAKHVLSLAPFTLTRA
jgi:hypothetical protein